MAQKVLSVNDLSKLLDMIDKQWREDRDAITTSYESLRGMITNPQDFAMNGMNLTKILEIMTKQTGQLVDLVKIIYKEEKEPNSLDGRDVENIFDEIKKDD